MAIQELYNKLRLKREYAREDVVLRLSIDELETLMFGLKEIGADVDTGYQYVLDFKASQQKEFENDKQLQRLINGDKLHD